MHGCADLIIQGEPIMCRPRYLLVVVLCIAGIAAAPDRQPSAGEAEIERLIAQLGDDSFENREAAGRALRKIDEPALPALRRAALESRSLEVRRRAHDLVDDIDPERKQARREAPVLGMLDE